MNTTIQWHGKPEPHGHIVAVFYSDIRGCVVRTMQRYGRSMQDCEVDDLTQDVAAHLLGYSLSRFNAKRGSLRDFVTAVAVKQTCKTLELHCNSRPHVSYTTTGADADEETASDYQRSTADVDDVRHHARKDAPITVRATSTTTGAVAASHDALTALAGKVARASLCAAIARLDTSEQSFLIALDGARSWGHVAERMGWSAAKVSREYRRIAAKLQSLLGD